jgi:hypothetical protein
LYFLGDPTVVATFLIGAVAWFAAALSLKPMTAENRLSMTCAARNVTLTPSFGDGLGDSMSQGRPVVALAERHGDGGSGQAGLALRSESPPKEND